MKSKKSQSSVEYLIIFAFLFASLVASSYFLFYYQSASQLKASTSKIDRFAHQMVAAVDEVFFTGGLSQKILDFDVPKNLNSVHLIGNQTIVFNVSTAHGLSDLVYRFNAPVFFYLNKSTLGHFYVFKHFNSVVFCPDNNCCNCTDNDHDLYGTNNNKDGKGLCCYDDDIDDNNPSIH